MVKCILEFKVDMKEAFYGIYTKSLCKMKHMLFRWSMEKKKKIGGVLNKSNLALLLE